jgi:hypothetical protein
LKQSAYGPHIVEYSTQYSKYVAHALDRIGLRLCLSQADTTQVGDLFFFIMNNFFSDRFVGRSMFNVTNYESVATDERENIASHFRKYLLICGDVLSNEVDIPYAIHSIINSQINTKCKQYIDDDSYYREYAIDLMNKISDLLLGEQDKAISERNKQELFDLIHIVIRDKNLIEHYLVHIDDLRKKPRKQVSLLPFVYYKPSDVKQDVWDKIDRQLYSLDINQYQSSLTKRLLEKFVNKSVFGSLRHIDRFVESIKPPNEHIKADFKRLLVIVKRQLGSEALSADAHMKDILEKHGLSKHSEPDDRTLDKLQPLGAKQKLANKLEKMKGKKQSAVAHFLQGVEDDIEATHQSQVLPTDESIDASKKLLLTNTKDEEPEYMPVYLMFDNVASVDPVCDERSLPQNERPKTNDSADKTLHGKYVLRHEDHRLYSRVDAIRSRIHQQADCQNERSQQPRVPLSAVLAPRQLLHVQAQTASCTCRRRRRALRRKR